MIFECSLSKFGSFSYFQTSLSLGVGQVHQKLQKFDINNLRLLFHYYILIPRKCPHKTPFKRQCPPWIIRPCNGSVQWHPEPDIKWKYLALSSDILKRHQKIETIVKQIGNSVSKPHNRMNVSANRKTRQGSLETKGEIRDDTRRMD